MQGLIDFAQQVALILAVLLPTFMYCAAIGLFLFAGWGLWQQAQPQNPFVGKPWVPWLSLLVSGACASFPVILTKVNISFGSSVSPDVVAGLSSYSTSIPDPGLGATPGATVINIVTSFQAFFEVFGAMTCFLAMIAWHTSMAGRSQRPWGNCGVQFLFGVALMNILTISQWLVGIFQA